MKVWRNRMFNYIIKINTKIQWIYLKISLLNLKKLKTYIYYILNTMIRNIKIKKLIILIKQEDLIFKLKTKLSNNLMNPN